MLKNLMPARAAAIDTEEMDELCDLDALEERKVTFKLHGKTHVLARVTTENFFAFWGATQEYRKGQKDHKTATDENGAYLKVVLSLCPTITLADVEKMSTMQKMALVTHLASKIVGKNLTAEIEKKNLAGLALLKSPVSS